MTTVLDFFQTLLYTQTRSGGSSTVTNFDFDIDKIKKIGVSLCLKNIESCINPSE